MENRVFNGSRNGSNDVRERGLLEVDIVASKVKQR